METLTLVQNLLLCLCGIGLVAIIIFIIRQKEEKIDYNKYIRILNDEEEINLKTLDKYNKEIDKVEKKILICKKELGMKLFDK